MVIVASSSFLSSGLTSTVVVWSCWVCSVLISFFCLLFKTAYTIRNVGVSKEINRFFKQRCIKFIKNGFKDFYIVQCYTIEVSIYTGKTKNIP